MGEAAVTGLHLPNTRGLGLANALAGLDLDRLLRIREIVKAAVPAEEMYGFTPDAGLPLGFEQARRTAQRYSFVSGALQNAPLIDTDTP